MAAVANPPLVVTLELEMKADHDPIGTPSACQLTAPMNAICSSTYIVIPISTEKTVAMGTDFCGVLASPE